MSVTVAMQSQSNSCHQLFDEDKLQSEFAGVIESMFTVALDLIEFSGRAVETVKLNNAIRARKNCEQYKFAAGYIAKKHTARVPSCNMKFDLGYELKRVADAERKLCIATQSFIKFVQVIRAWYPGKSIVLRKDYRTLRKQCRCKLIFLFRLADIKVDVVIEEDQNIIVGNLIRTLKAVYDMIIELLRTLNIPLDKETKDAVIMMRDTMKFKPLATSVLTHIFTSFNILCTLVKYAEIPIDVEALNKLRCREKQRLEKFNTMTTEDEDNDRNRIVVEFNKV
ncbi:hypothetical protein GJ496_002232 [Pomphorhynchus laevis]|nr:hypothetical protein GJ496_002232 [Pomphorhynchus laevis]